LEADVLEEREPELDGEKVVVACGVFEGELAVGDGEGCILLLPKQERATDVMKKFPARAFEEFQVAGIVNMIAEGALGVGNAALTGEDRLVHGLRLGWEEGFANVVLGGCHRFVEGMSPGFLFCWSCGEAKEVYYKSVGWQDIIAMLIVAGTAGTFLWARMKRKKRPGLQKACGSCAEGQVAGGPSIIFHARRGEQPRIVVKYK
jgi:hypothetical protein